MDHDPMSPLILTALYVVGGLVIFFMLAYMANDLPR